MSKLPYPERPVWRVDESDVLGQDLFGVLDRDEPRPVLGPEQIADARDAPPLLAGAIERACPGPREGDINLYPIFPKKKRGKNGRNGVVQSGIRP